MKIMEDVKERNIPLQWKLKGEWQEKEWEDKEKIKKKKKIDSWKEAAAGQENDVQSKASQRPGGDFF